MSIDFMRPKLNGQGITSILLLGIDDPIALPLVRSLGGTLPEAELHALSRRNGKLQKVCRYSRYLKTHRYLESVGGEELFQEIVNRIGESGAAILLPVDEFFVRFLSRFQDRLRKHVKLPPLPRTEVFDSLVHKNRLNELLVKYGFPNPRTGMLSSIDEGFEEVHFPCLLKPVRGSAGKGIFIISEKDELLRKRESLNCKEYILQEFIPGQNIDCSFLAVDGEIKAFTIQKGLSNIGFIFSTAIRFENNPQVIGIAQDLVEKTKYSGVAHLDFRLDERDGQPKLIDFNARFWYSLLGSRAAGVDFAQLCCLSALDIPFEKPLFSEKTYLMGRSTFQYIREKKFKMLSYVASKAVLTDLWVRMQDPLPEFARFFPDRSRSSRLQ